MSDNDALVADSFIHLSDLNRFCDDCISDEELYIMGARFLHTFYDLSIRKNNKVLLNSNKQQRIKNFSGHNRKVLIQLVDLGYYKKLLVQMFQIKIDRNF